MSQFKLTNDFENADGTSLKGHVKTTYQELVKAFGEPIESDGYKVSGEWIFSDRDGNGFTIYDWKSTSLYDTEYPSVEAFRNETNPVVFNIGSNRDASEFVKWLESKLSQVETTTEKFGFIA